MIQTNNGTDNYLFQQENGLNDYNTAYNPLTDPTSAQYAPINAYATTNFAQIDEGNNTMLIYSVFPDLYIDSSLTMQLTVNGKLYAQSPVITARGSPFTLNEATTKIDVMLVARQRQYKLAVNTVNTTANGVGFLVGHWIEEAKESSTR